MKKMLHLMSHLKQKDMNNTKQSKTLRNGFKSIPKTDLAINEFGTVYNITTGHTRTPQNIVTPTHGRITVEKVLLWVFKNETPRSGHIMHIDGNKSNKSLTNIKYTTPKELVTAVKLNRTNLVTALRCYFQINKKSKPDINQLETKILLSSIAETRAFHISNENKEFYGVFDDWLSDYNRTIVEVSKMHRLAIRAGKNAVYMFTNKLTSEICNDLKAGLLIKQPYLLTKSEVRREETEKFLKYGIKPTAPFRIPSDIKAKFEEIGIKPPTIAELNKEVTQKTESKLVVWLALAFYCLKNAPKETNITKIKKRVKLEEMIKQRMFDSKTK